MLLLLLRSYNGAAVWAMWLLLAWTAAEQQFQKHCSSLCDVDLYPRALMLTNSGLTYMTAAAYTCQPTCIFLHKYPVHNAAHDCVRITSAPAPLVCSPAADDIAPRNTMLSAAGLRARAPHTTQTQHPQTRAG
jgi:hypothetical protein